MMDQIARPYNAEPDIGEPDNDGPDIAEPNKLRCCIVRQTVMKTIAM